MNTPIAFSATKMQQAAQWANRGGRVIPFLEIDPAKRGSLIEPGGLHETG
jgi:hypothetical protein